MNRNLPQAGSQVWETRVFAVGVVIHRSLLNAWRGKRFLRGRLEGAILFMVQKSRDHQLIWRIYHYLQGFIHVRW